MTDTEMKMKYRAKRGKGDRPPALMRRTRVGVRFFSALP